MKNFIICFFKKLCYDDEIKLKKWHVAHFGRMLNKFKMVVGRIES
jgi:hypothetical protein